MFQFAQFDEIAGIAHGIEITNPAMVARIRRAADSLKPHEIAAYLASAITEAADAAHARAYEEDLFGEASADAIVDAEYHDELAEAWSLVASEHQIASFASLGIRDGAIH
ncbi:hypothetical protein [Sphingobium algorifonticola]|uniref:Uncharacterized protein n=1 Tax=Sphingobium algorifonticola TaxID=2008318 RepID=A0A437J360_9SPHN|nr:hypothetical protein [Sphingobium algorifonticola]RVT38675.1 hypothetical protein ENE74_17460 [Sphingobium algorifonticola]